MIRELIRENRSYRRFEENHKLSFDFVKSLINLARLSPSSRNQQALKFKIINEQADCDKLFPNLAWAGYLKEWAGPSIGERPSGYIIIMGDTELGSSFSVDLGICAQSILLGAVNDGYGGCMIASLRKEKIRADFKLPDHYEILMVIALGKPSEKVLIDKVEGGDIKYWRDENDVHHVPKRDIDEIIA